MAKKYKWLKEITDIVSFSIHDCEGKYIGPYVSPHFGRFFHIPHVIRRCFFLTVTEQAVLWEILAWMNNEGGYCRLSQKTIAFYTRLSDRTVRKVIKSLVDKGFISKKLSNSTDVYKINKLNQNPYVLVSEFIHGWCHSCVLPKNGQEMMEFEIDYSMPASLECMRKAVEQFIENDSDYFVTKMNTANLDQEAVLQNFRYDIFEAIGEIYQSLD